jgi:beta-glucosidase/6-phospho-beta-glucosidase/beta-galactosidase
MWVHRQGGWTSQKTVADFLALAQVVAGRYGSQVRSRLTLNEPVFHVFVEASGTYSALHARHGSHGCRC